MKRNNMTQKLYKSEIKNQIVAIDGSEFVECIFDTCIMRFSGVGPSVLNGCTFANCKWEFAGPAALTASFMAALYKGSGEGGRALISDMIYNITGGEMGTPILPQPTPL
jgi:hypothetical protein